MYKEPPYQEGGNIQEKVVMMIMLVEGHIEIEDPLKEGDIKIKVEGHLIKEDTLVKYLLGEDIPTEMEDPLQEEDTQEEDPLMEMEDPLMEEDPLIKMEDPWRWRTPGPLGGQRPPGPQGPPGPVRSIIVQKPQVALDTFALENTFDSVGQSMLQLARAQDQTNRQLQQHIQQGKVNMQAHMAALQQLATSTYQRNFDHTFASIPIYDGSDREGFFPWLKCLEAACFYSLRNIKTEALGRSAGPVQNVLMALPNATSWRPIREELKRCFPDQTSLGHAAAQLENMTQKPNEPLRHYIFRYSKIHKSVTKRDACYDTDPSRWFRFLTTITNTTIADKITQSEFLPQNLNNVLRRPLD